MKHIKKFNELFDNDDLKSKLEIPYLQGNLDKKELVRSAIPFKGRELFNFFNNSLVKKFPFFDYCFDENTRRIYGCNEDPNEKNCHHYYFKNEKIFVIFSVVMWDDNDYDCNILVRDPEDSDIIVYEQEYNECSIDKIIDIVKSDLIPHLIESGFGDLMSRKPGEKLWSEN